MASKILVNSLKRLYQKNKDSDFILNNVTDEWLQSRIPDLISQEEYNQIVGV